MSNNSEQTPKPQEDQPLPDKENWTALFTDEQNFVDFLKWQKEQTGKPKEDKPERLFTLDEMKEAWEAGAEWYEDNEDKLRFGKRSSIQPKDIDQYFKEKFNINL